MEFSNTKYCFNILIDGLVCAKFAEVSGVENTNSTIEYRIANSQTVVLPLMKPTTITLKHGRSDNKEFKNWIVSVDTDMVVHKNISIVLLDGNGTSAAAVWELTAAYPVQYDAVKQKFNAKEAVFESVELMHAGIHRAQ